MNNSAFGGNDQRLLAHDHRQSLWIIAGGALLWCYRCGAWRPNVAGKLRWHKPTGPNGENPACED